MNLKCVTDNSYHIFLHSNDYFSSLHSPKGLWNDRKNEKHLSSCISAKENRFTELSRKVGAENKQDKIA